MISVKSNRRRAIAEKLESAEFRARLVTDGSPFDALCAALALYAGMRRNEIALLFEGSSVYFNPRLRTVAFAPVGTKFGRSELVYLPRNLCAALESFLAARAGNDAKKSFGVLTKNPAPRPAFFGPQWEVVRIADLRERFLRTVDASDFPPNVKAALTRRSPSEAKITIADEIVGVYLDKLEDLPPTNKE